MGRGNLSPSEIEQLLKSPYILSADEKRVFYSNEFKLRFMKEYYAGKKPVQIFRDAGLDPYILGSKRIERATARWKETYSARTLDIISCQKNEKKTATPKQLHELILKYQEQLTKKQSEIDVLKAQIELLKKLAGEC